MRYAEPSDDVLSDHHFSHSSLLFVSWHGHGGSDGLRGRSRGTLGGMCFVIPTRSYRLDLRVKLHTLQYQINRKKKKVKNNREYSIAKLKKRRMYVMIKIIVKKVISS